MDIKKGNCFILVLSDLKYSGNPNTGHSNTECFGLWFLNILFFKWSIYSPKTFNKTGP